MKKLEEIVYPFQLFVYNQLIFIKYQKISNKFKIYLHNHKITCIVYP